MISIALALATTLAIQTPTPSPSPTPPVAPPPFVVSILHENSGPDAVVRFVLSGPPSSYSAIREAGSLVVRIAAEPLPGLTLPAPRAPLAALSLAPEPGFLLRIATSGEPAYEILRDSSSLRLVLKGAATPEAGGRPAGSADASPSPTPGPAQGAVPRPGLINEPSRPDTSAVDTADLYRRLFPETGQPVNPADRGPGEVTAKDNWYSNFKWLGIQARPWVSVSYVDGKTTQVASGAVNTDSYWVIQPNLGLGFSPRIGGRDEGEAQWKINYTPRFRRLANLGLPHLTSHFFDVGVDQPVAAIGSVFGSLHHSRGVLETEEVDAGREYGIGLNRVIDTGLQRFRRTSFDFGLRLSAFADTELTLAANRNKVDYGDDGASSTAARAFFDYDTRMFNATLRRGFGEGRFLSALMTISDTPTQVERKQIEGRGYTYGVSLEGDIVALTTGRVFFGYRTQENPKAGVGGQSYKDVTWGAQLVREVSDTATFGLSADRKLYLSAYADNGFYVADQVKADMSARTFMNVYVRGSASYQNNHYKTSPQSNDGSSLVLRTDRIKYWSAGLARNLREWLFLRLDYVSESRDSNLDRFDIKSRSLTFQLGLGFFGTPGGGRSQSW